MPAIALLDWNHVWLRLLLGLAISGAVHYFVYWTLVKPAHVPPRIQRAISIAMIALYFSIPITTTSRIWC